MKTSYRTLQGLLLLICVTALLSAYYMQYVMHLLPCDLCMLQRGMLYSIAILLFTAMLHNPKSIGRWGYCILITLFAGAGAAIAGRQVYLQQLPLDAKPSCGPGLEFLLNDLPFWEAITTFIAGSGDCATVQWTFLGLSLPFWTGVLFIFLIVAEFASVFYRK